MGDEMVVGTAVPLSEVARAAAKLWWILLVAGILSLAFGVWLLFKPVTGAETIAWVVGIYLVVVGVVDLFHARSAVNRTPAVVAGIILMATGLLIAFWPDVTVRVIAIVWGIGFLLGGLVRVVSAFADKGYGWGWRLFLGVLGVVVGVVFVVWPNIGAGVIFFLVGLSAVITGIMWVVMSFSLRKAPERVAAAGAGDVAVFL
jgi:uncharacterized membrane protein HdeD (DUF308 family)